MTTLTHAERLVLIQQFEILRALHAKDEGRADEYTSAINALEIGAAQPIRMLFGRLYPGLTEDECKLVNQTMAMYSAMQHAFDQLPNPAVVSKGEVEFPGFDGNDETSYRLYTAHVLHYEQRFRRLRPAYDDGDGVGPHLEQYRASTAEWIRRGSPTDMSEADLRSLLDV
jgi:uncharacterized protein YfbU (UPF0304 family)